MKTPSFLGWCRILRAHHGRFFRRLDMRFGLRSRWFVHLKKNLRFATGCSYTQLIRVEISVCC
jgi:hypothetical protein